MTRILLAALLLLASPARAQTEDAQQLLEDGRRLYADLEYQNAQLTLTRALRIDGLPDAFRIELLETLGFVEVVLEHEAAAREAFEQLFAIDPYFVVREPSGSPRVAALVAAVRARVVSDAAIDPDVDTRVELPRSARRDGPTEIRITVSSPQITTVVLEVRGDHDAAFRPLEATGGGGEFVVALPAWADSEELELYAEGRNARGQLVTRSGSPLRPLHLSVTGPVAASEPAAGPGGSIVDEWWFWTLAAVVVVGAAVGIGVGVTLSNDARAPAGTLPPGRVVLP